MMWKEQVLNCDKLRTSFDNAHQIARMLLVIIAPVFLGGCETKSDGPSLYHEVSVPKQFMGGRGLPAFISDHERYIDAYERGWWACVENYAKNIDYKTVPGDRYGNGWGSEVVGYSAGYTDAENRIQKLIRQYGKQKTHDHLVQVQDFAG